MSTTHALARLGVPLAKAQTPPEALHAAGLAGWNVRKVPLLADTLAGRPVPVAGNAVIRDTPRGPEALGLVGDAHYPLQNEDTLELLSALQVELGGGFAFGGPLNGGRQAFVAMKLPGRIPARGDALDMFVASVSSHDGNASHRLIRLTANRRTGALLELPNLDPPSRHRTRHTAQGAQLLHQGLPEMLEDTLDHFDVFAAQADELAARPLNAVEFGTLIQAAYGVGPAAPPGVVTKAEEKLDLMAELFHHSPRTRWGALSALAEWADHHSPVQAADPDTRRALKAFLDPAFKTAAAELVG